MNWLTPIRRVAVTAATAWLTAVGAHAEAPAASAPSDCPPTARALTPEQAEAGQRDARDRGFLWRVTRGGKSSYLFGTIHVATWPWMFPGPTVAQALKESDTVALELDLLDPDILRRMRAGMQARRDAPLPAALRDRLRRQMADACIAPEALAGMGPALQVATLSMLAGRRDGLDAAYGIDNFLAGFARGAGKRVVSLESPELQLQALEPTDAAGTEEMVESGLADLESGRARPLLRRLAMIWAESDEAELTGYESWCECTRTAADRAMLKRLLDDRNPDLAAAVDTLHRSGSRVFAAVGSLHMIGPKGLPALLAARGYVVERVSFAR